VVLEDNLVPFVGELLATGLLGPGLSRQVRFLLTSSSSQMWPV
jgi:hypothetical protein